MNSLRFQFVSAFFTTLVLGCGHLATQTSTSHPIRLEPGLVAVSATNDAVLNKDYEAVVTIEKVDSEGTRASTSWAIPDKDAPDGVRRQSANCLERAQDTQHGRKLIIWHLPGDPETFPGATGATPSLDVFNEVRAHGEASIVVGAVSETDSQGLGAIGNLLTGRKYFRGTVKRLGNESVRVLVDGVPTVLNAIHVGGTLSVGKDSADTQFWWLDDPASRFALRFKFQDSIAQVVKIDRPKQAELFTGTSCRSELPGIYFLTDSAQLLPASQPAIQRLAATLREHSDWAITIEGHTDNTGSDQHNLDLSRRRAESLKNELTSKYGLQATRVKTAGYGRNRPVDTNATLEGRAHNRRVEISRCG